MRFFIFKTKAFLVFCLITAVCLLSGVAAAAWNDDNGSNRSPHVYTYADCKARLTKDMDHAFKDPKWKGNKDRPKECANVTDDQADKLISDLMQDRLEQSFGNNN